MDKRIIAAAIAVIAILAVVAGYAGSNSVPGTGNTTVTDMLGRTIHVPGEINTVLSTSPTTTMTVYMLAPDKLGGWNFKPTDEVKKYIPTKYQNLPVIGGWFGSTTGNYETFISMNPDVVLEGYNIQGDPNSTINERQQKMGSISVVGVQDTTNATQYTPSIKFLGQLLGAQQQADKLISFYDNVTQTVNSTVSTIPEDQKVKVYYAEGTTGLQTDPSGSMHGQLIDLCGGINVATVPLNLKSGGKTQVSMEQVLNWTPDVIITEDSTFYSNVYSNSSWKSVPAVANHRVYLVPNAPFSWFDHPPAVNTIIGIPWTAKVLYPDKFKDLDMNKLTKEFYLDFYHMDLRDSDVRNILKNQTI